jgi:hypothetical protein
MRLNLGLLAVLVTGVTVLALGVMAGYDIFAAAPALLVVASGLFLVTVFYVMSLGDDDRGHRPPLVMFVAGMAIVRRAMSSIRTDVPSERSHRTFAIGTGGHLAQMATGLRVIAGMITAGSPRLHVARSATA